MVALTMRKSIQDNREEAEDTMVESKEWEAVAVVVKGVLQIKTIMKDKVMKISRELTINLNSVVKHLKAETDLISKTVRQEIMELPGPETTFLWEAIEVVGPHEVPLVEEVEKISEVVDVAVRITEVVDVVEMTPIETISEISVRHKKDCKSHL